MSWSIRLLFYPPEYKNVLNTWTECVHQSTVWAVTAIKVSQDNCRSVSVQHWYDTVAQIVNSKEILMLNGMVMRMSSFV